LLKTEKVTLVVEALGDRKVRVNSSAWDAEGEVLEIRALDWAWKQLAVRRRPRTPDKATERPPS
jgi:hypothetical protein